MWILENKEFVLDENSSAIGFVYLITDLKNNKKYIGKKNFFFSKKLPPLKGKIKKRIVVKESDWKDYYGSNDELKEIVQKGEAHNFKREILRLCYSKGELSYWELKYQMEYDVLLKPDEFYNSFVGAKIHRNHVLQKK
jgi:hypothetical protein